MYMEIITNYGEKEATEIEITFPKDKKKHTTDN